MKRSTHPTAFIVFGATGDLTQNKLYPALYELSRRNLLPRKFFLYGIAREKMTKSQFEKDIKKDLKFHYDGKNLERKAVDQLVANLRYIPADLADQEGYVALEKDILSREKKLGHGIQRLFYLALPPSLFSLVVGNVNACRLGRQMCTKEHVRSRIILEKPFGYDLKTARSLSEQIKSVFKDRQVYRIDHYLGKEAFQNIFALRFANELFEPLWNNKHIAEIQINALETVSLERRFAYYDGAGAIRDMLQNHLMQFLAFLTMDQPTDLSADMIRKSKARVLSQVRPFGGRVQMTRGQYRGYRQEKGIPRTSNTETYVAVKLEIDSPRWRGVPIYIRTGKNLAYKDTSANIRFRSQMKGSEGNVMNIQISPSPSISLKVNVQAPGFDLKTTEAAMHYCRGESTGEKAVGDYERLLLDVIEGDQRLFTSEQEVLSGWEVVTPFLVRAKRDKIHKYKPGSLGPKTPGIDWIPQVTTCPYDQ